MSKSDTVTVQPWWKFGHVWLVLAGPAVVVVAGFVTLYLAVRSPNPIVTEADYRAGVKVDAVHADAKTSLAPAIQARNHAATGLPPASGPAPRP